METKFKQITEDEFYAKFNPIRNKFPDRNGSFDDCAFETYSPEIDYVVKVANKTPRKVWTIVDGDDGMYIISGYHIVNRISYLITKEEIEEGVEYEVELEKFGEE